MNYLIKNSINDNNSYINFHNYYKIIKELMRKIIIAITIIIIITIILEIINNYCSFINLTFIINNYNAYNFDLFHCYFHLRKVIMFKILIQSLE